MYTVETIHLICKSNLLSLSEENQVVDFTAEKLETKTRKVLCIVWLLLIFLGKTLIKT